MRPLLLQITVWEVKGAVFFIINLYPIVDFFINYEKTALQTFFLLCKDVREQHGNQPREIAKNFRVLRKCLNKFDCLIFVKCFLFVTLSQNSFNNFLILFTSYLYFIFAFRYFYCSYVDTCFYFLFHCFRNCIHAELLYP